jgi:toxin CcdB
MARLDLHKLSNGIIVVEVQASILDHLRTRVVVPFLHIEDWPKPISRLNPIFEIEGKRLVLMPQQMGAVLVSDLAACIGSLSDQHDIIINALDMLLTGY